MIKRVCLFCGGRSTGSQEQFQRPTQLLAHQLARNKFEIIYGGGYDGLMGAVATSILEAGGRLSTFLLQEGGPYPIPREKKINFQLFKTFAERKQLMIESAEAFLILPGGLGTLDEASDVLALKQQGLHHKPILFVDIEGFWSNLLPPLMAALLQERFITETTQELYQILSPDKVLLVLNSV